MAEDDFLGALHGRTIHGQNHIGNPENRVEGRLNGIRAMDGHVTVQNFLKYLRVRHQPLAITDQSLQEFLCIRLMRMGRTDQIHRNV